MIRQIKTVDFADIFSWAETDHNISWSACNDIFFRTEFFPYKRHREFYLSELEANYEERDYAFDPNYKRAIELMILWMKENKLENIIVTCG